MFTHPPTHTHTPGLLLFTALDPLTLLSCYDPLPYSCLALRKVKEQPGTVGDELRDEVHPQKFSPQNWGGNERWVTRTIDVKKSNFSKDKKYHTHSLTRMWPPVWTSDKSHGEFTDTVPGHSPMVGCLLMFKLNFITAGPRAGRAVIYKVTVQEESRRK